jgi:hypothetical protein
MSKEINDLFEINDLLESNKKNKQEQNDILKVIIHLAIRIGLISLCFLVLYVYESNSNRINWGLPYIILFIFCTWLCLLLIEAIVLHIKGKKLIRNANLLLMIISSLLIYGLFKLLV